jgi:hypothetical protein
MRKNMTKDANTHGHEKYVIIAQTAMIGIIN